MGFALLGAVLGLVVAHVVGPTNGEVRAAARSLVPPGTVITEQGSGYLGDFPPLTRGPYSDFFRVSGGGATHPQRVTTFRNHAEGLGWHMVRVEEAPGATVLHLERKRVVAQVDVDRIGESYNRIQTRKSERRGFVRPAVVGAVGASAGVLFGVLVLLWRLDVRRGGPQRHLGNRPSGPP